MYAYVRIRTYVERRAQGAGHLFSIRLLYKHTVFSFFFFFRSPAGCGRPGRVKPGGRGRVGGWAREGARTKQVVTATAHPAGSK